MKTLYVASILAGVCFGIYPTFLNRNSHLNGYLSITIFTFLVFLTVAPLSLSKLGGMSETHWKSMIAAAVISGIGMIFLSGVLSKITKEMVPQILVLISISQILTATIIDVIMNKSITSSKGLGFVFAIVTVILLCKK